MQSQNVYVSITGLKLKAFFLAPIFWTHAMRSMAQAQSAEGCLQAGARTIEGVHHTRSVWLDKSYMQKYLTSGAHLQAMKRFPSFATGKTIGFETDEVPGWDEVHQIWCDRGIDV